MQIELRQCEGVNARSAAGIFLVVSISEVKQLA